MKTLIKIFFTIFFAVIFFSCKKNISMISYQGGTAPVISANKSGVIPLSFANKDNEAITLAWTNPAYKFSTGLNSQDVFYSVEIDTTGANFTNPNRKVLSVSKDLSKTFTQTELNSILFSEMRLVAGIPHNIEIRVTSYLANNSVPLISNILKFTGVTPYVIPPKVEPPVNGTLWITGSAVASNWQNPIAAPNDNKQKFTKLSNTLYELTVDMIPGGGYKILQTNDGNWSTQYSFVTGSGNALGGEFVKKDASQFDAPAAAGTYKISVDFQSGRFSLTKL